MKEGIRGAALVATLSLLLPALAFAGLTKSGCDQKMIDQQTNPSYEGTFKEMIDSELGGRNVTWTSCFRDKAAQAAACRNACPDHNPNGCPGTCAPPGQSNHQKAATADVSGLSGIKEGCEFLYKVCQKMRSQNSQVGCEIGGYPGGSHHLAAAVGVKNSAYNQCSFLKDKMGLPPDKTDQQKKRGDDMMNDIMKAAGPLAQAAQALAPKDSGGGSGQQQPSSLSPEGGATSPTPSSHNDGTGSSSSSDTGSSKGNPNSITPDRITMSLPNGNTVSAKSVDTGTGGAGSDITHHGDGSYGSGTGASSGAPGSPFTGAAFTGAGGGGGGGGVGGGGGARSGVGETAAGAGTGTDAQTNEMLASFAGGNKFTGGGKASGNMAGGDTDDAVKNIVKDFSEQMNRDPASQNTDGIGAEEGETVFTRVHEAYRRCALGGCVTTR